MKRYDLEVGRPARKFYPMRGKLANRALAAVGTYSTVRHEVAAVSMSANETLAWLSEQLAQLLHMSLQNAEHAISSVRSKKYDALVERWLSIGTLKSDPREDPEFMQASPWYRPKLHDTASKTPVEQASTLA